MKSGVQPWIGWGSKAGWLSPGHLSHCGLRATAPEELRVRRFAQDDLGLGPLAAQHAPDAGDRSPVPYPVTK